MGLIVRVVLAVGGSLASLFMAQDSPNYSVTQAMFGILAVVVLVVGLVAFRNRDR